MLFSENYTKPMLDFFKIYIQVSFTLIFDTDENKTVF